MQREASVAEKRNQKVDSREEEFRNARPYYRKRETAG
jgi:hypothetical protein